MDAETFSDHVENAKATELDRLGSQQSLVALTDADLTAEQVLRAAARSEAAACETFAGWAESEADSDAREAFEALADQEGEHYERIVAELDGEFDAGDEEGSGAGDERGTDVESGGGSDAGVDSMHDHLRDLDGTVERAAALVGRSLVADRTLLQVVNFFVNEADERQADLFRDLRAETSEGVSTGADLLERHCDDEDDWERAREAAAEVVQVAYDDYAETLEGMGLDPKPIC